MATQEPSAKIPLRSLISAYEYTHHEDPERLIGERLIEQGSDQSFRVEKTLDLKTGVFRPTGIILLYTFQPEPQKRPLTYLEERWREEEALDRWETPSYYETLAQGNA